MPGGGYPYPAGDASYCEKRLPLRVRQVSWLIPVQGESQWRYRGGLSPPSLFSLAFTRGHLTGMSAVVGGSVVDGMFSVNQGETCYP